ncbi:synaptophysin-like [Amphiura filiformis]|uniref:synaptophysin-like n=1 Tax=Amphiura filiformis TaxID=82378 RepID=UPI003B212E20
MEGQQPPPSSGEEPPYRLRVLSEPRGFLRIIEFFLAIFMFATTAGFSDSMKYSVQCSIDPPINEEVPYSYPFKLYTYKYPSSYCTSGLTTPPRLNAATAEPEGSARFFVCIGVLAMLYCAVVLVWYVFLEVKFLHLEIVPLVDTMVTAVFSLLFFIASCAWAAGVGDVKWWTTFSNVRDRFYKETCMSDGVACVGNNGGYAGLNVSLIFGFLNCGVWAANVWFTLKETGWFRANGSKARATATRDIRKTHH